MKIFIDVCIFLTLGLYITGVCDDNVRGYVSIEYVLTIYISLV